MSITEKIHMAAAELPPAQQQHVLDFILSLKHEIEDEDRAIGEAGAKFAAMVLEPEDFSDWEKNDRG